MREFDWIERYFRPLTEGLPGALGLADDAALLPALPDRSLVVTVDAIVADRHFLRDDPPDLIAAKLMRVNLSDLAAMGAEPAWAVLTAALPKDITEDWLEHFSQGLARDQEAFSLRIAGGDTVRTDGPLTLSLTAMGWVDPALALRRDRARPGQRVWVSGTIGDSVLGLQVAKGGDPALPEGVATQDRDYLLGRYRLPVPRVALGRAVLGLASAGMDVSDGLAQDLGHIAAASGVDIEIAAEDVPLSDAGRSLVSAGQASLSTCLSGGDDYELVLTASPEHDGALAEAARRAGVALTAIGHVVPAAGPRPAVRIHDRQGDLIEMAAGGYSHF